MRLLPLTPCSISCLIEDKTYQCLYVCLLLSNECLFVHVLFTSAHAYIFIGGATYDIYPNTYWLPFTL